MTPAGGGARGLYRQRAARARALFSHEVMNTCENFSIIWAEGDSSIKTILFLKHPSS